MPRDASGNYTLPAGNPVVSGTIIETAWANPTMSDIAVQLNNVLTRDGLLGPITPIKFTDGTVAAPGIAFNTEASTGFYHPAAGVLAVSVQGVEVGQWTTAGYEGALTGSIDFTGSVEFTAPVIVTDTLTVNGDTTFNGQLNVDTINCTDDAIFDSLFTVNGAATFNDPVLINDFAEFTSSVTFDTNILVNGTATLDTAIVTDIVRVGDTGLRPTQQLVGSGAFIIDGMTVDASGVGGRLVFLNGSDSSGVAFSAIYAVATRPSGGTGAAVAATGLIRSGSASPTFAFSATGGGLVELTIGGSAALTLVTNFGI